MTSPSPAPQQPPAAQQSPTPEEEQLTLPTPQPQRTIAVRGSARTVQVDDVDDVIGLAAELCERDANKLTISDIEDIGLELGIEPKYVRRAMTALEQRRSTEITANAEAATRTRTTRIYAIVISASLLLLAFAASYSAQAELRQIHVEVQQTRAQVDNVMDRRVGVQARYANAPASNERNAELDGADNRVRVERRNYDKAAAKYNAAAGGPMTAIAARIFGLPTSVPMSNAVKEW